MSTLKKLLKYGAVLSMGVMIGLEYEEAPAREVVAHDPAGAVISEEQLGAGVSLEYLGMVAPEVRIMTAVNISDQDNMGGFNYHLYDYDINYLVNFDLYAGARYVVYIGLEGEILGYELTDQDITGGLEV